MDEESGDKPGPLSVGAAVSAPADPAAGAQAASSSDSEARNPRSRLRRLGLRQQRLCRRARQSEPVRERDQLAGAAGEPHCHPADGGRRPPGHDDAPAADDGISGIRFRASPAWCSPPGSSRGGGGDDMRGLTSTIVLLVVLGGLVGYIYFVDAGRETTDPDAKPKAFVDLSCREHRGDAVQEP